MNAGVSVEQFTFYNNAANNNKEPILAELSRLFIEPGSVLEVGSGSGQHAVCFANALPHLAWQPTDRGEYYDGLKQNLSALPVSNISSPRFLDASDFSIEGRYDYAFCANVLHIMSEALIAPLINGLAGVMSNGGVLVFYGPYKYSGRFTTTSNERFDQWLKDRNPESGIRDIELVTSIAEQAGFVHREDITMPANNQLLVFDKAGV